MLTVATRKKYFKELGLGEYNKANILKLQKKYFSRKADQDGIYGKDTDALLRHVHNCSTVKNFEPQEFKCPCGKCTGYPTYMRVNELKLIQAIRTHYGKPMTITSGLRCKAYNNSLANSSPTSAHLKGKAVDFYMAGVTDTLKNRRTAIEWIKKQKNHDYTYGDGISSKGAISAPNMGNAMHTQAR